MPSVLNETITEKEREVYSLPVGLGGLGIPIISEKTKNELAASLEITALLTDIIISQENKLPDAASVNLIRANVDKRNKELLTSKVKHIEDTSTPEINTQLGITNDCNLPSKCSCGSNFDITHALNCKRGVYVIM